MDQHEKEKRPKSLNRRSEVSIKFTTREAAHYLGRKPQTLFNWNSLGRGPRRHKLFGRIFYLKGDLDAFIRANEEVIEG